MYSRTVPALFAAALLAGCSGMSPSNAEPAAATQTFLASKEQVVLAARTAITEIGYSVTDTSDASPTTTLYFSKPLTSLSWSKSGKIMVTEQTPTITDASTKDTSSARIFKAIRHNLPQ